MSALLRKSFNIIAGAVLFIAMLPQVADARENADIPTLSPEHVSEMKLAPGESLRYREGSSAKIALESDETSDKVMHNNIMLTQRRTAPSCITANREKGFVQVYNNCATPLYVKVALNFAPDSDCKTVQPGTRTNISPARGFIDGVILCA